MCRAARPMPVSRLELLSLLFAITIAAGPVHAQSVVKPAYLYGPTTFDLSRTPPPGLEDPVTLDGGTSAAWTLSPAIAADLTLTAGSIEVVLYLRELGPGADRTVTVDLGYTGPVSGSIGSDTQSLTLGSTPLAVTFTIPLASDLTLAAGSALQLTVTNEESRANRKVRIEPNLSGGSRVELDVSTYINIDSLETYGVSYPGGSPVSGFAPGTTAYVRTDVSDPFGSFDISGVLVDILDPSGTPVVSGAPMILVNDSGAATATYEYAYAIPAAGPTGVWTARVVAIEGSEGTVTDLGTTVFAVSPLPQLLVFKSVLTIDDPVNGTTNPKAIPGANVLYTIGATNLGSGPTDADSVAISDTLPPNLALFVGDVGGAGSGPMALVDGSPASGLSYVYGGLGDVSDDLEFDDGSGTFAYTPLPDADGYDSNVRAVRIRPGGALGYDTGSGDPSFEVRFRARVL